jgi:hypothetical protein
MPARSKDWATRLKNKKSSCVDFSQSGEMVKGEGFLMMIELDNDKRREAANKEEAERDLEVRGVFRAQSRFVLGGRSNIAAGNGLSPGDQQYVVTDSEWQNVPYI